MNDKNRNANQSIENKKAQIEQIKVDNENLEKSIQEFSSDIIYLYYFFNIQ